MIDGTPLLFSIDSSIVAQYRQYDDGDAPFYGRYATFVCPAMSPGETLRIMFGVQTDYVDDLDTYMYLFEGSTFVLGSETLVDQDDDGGSGDYDVFENTLLEFPEGTLTPGQSYILELTTYSDSDTGNVKVIADVVPAPPTGLVFTGLSGPQSITGGEAVSFAAALGPTPSLTTTLLDTTWTLKDPSDVVITAGTLPISHLRTLWTSESLSSGVAYTMVASGITFTITRIGFGPPE